MGTFFSWKRLACRECSRVFSKHSKKLVVYYLLQTVRSRSDFVQVYELGHLVREYTVFVPKIPLLYYVFVYFWFLATVIRIFLHLNYFMS